MMDTKEDKESADKLEAHFQKQRQPLPMAALVPNSHTPDVHCDFTPEELATLPFPCYPPGQAYAVISVVAPKGWGTKRTSNVLAVRFYGAFETKEEAKACMAKAQRMGYNFFDMHVIDMREGFIPVPPPDIAEAGDAIPTYYNHPILQEIMRGHRDIINESSERLLARMAATPASQSGLAKALVPDEKKG